VIGEMVELNERAAEDVIKIADNANCIAFINDARQLVGAVIDIAQAAGCVICVRLLPAS
jgi:hypothetical protein